MSVSFHIVGPADEALLNDLFGEIDDTYFRPHPFTQEEARSIVRQSGQDVYAVLLEDGRAVAYGMLRGWSEGYHLPSLGIAVRQSSQGRGLGRVMMGHLHAEAGRHGATVVRLRVHPQNLRARRLYEALGYAYAGEDRGELVMLLDVVTRPEANQSISQSAPHLAGKLIEVDAPEWDAVLREARHDFYHLPAYATLSALEMGGRAAALFVTDGDKTLLLPLLIRLIPDGGLDATSPYGYPGPIGSGAEDPRFVRLALAAGCEVLRDAGLVSVFVRLHPLLNLVQPQGIGVLVSHGDTVSMDLTRTPATVWAEMRMNHRRDIVRAARLGFVARMDEDWTAFEAFKRLYRETMERRGAAPFYFFSDAYFEQLRKALGRSLHLCIVEDVSAVVAAGLFVETDGSVEYHLSGSSAASHAVQSTKLMIHFAAGWARERGDTVLHLGGGVGGVADSLLQFKCGFSPVRHPFATLRIVIDERAYDRLSTARHPEIDSRARSGYFPSYRLA